MRTNKIVVGILAHVDAGKTTLSEAVLFHSGSIKKIGRVDHGTAFFDTDHIERERGITVFSKQAQFNLGGKEFTLLDTPGHADFAAEAERTLQILDYAILVINGADGVQSHTLTLWKLLKSYDIPVFLFINKMDQMGAERGLLVDEVKKRLDVNCVDFSKEGSNNFMEELAMCAEELMESYLDSGGIDNELIIQGIAERKVFPCFFGAALKSQGVEEFLRGMERYTAFFEYPDEFGAKIYKITRDSKGNRLSHMKITGGTLKVKDLLTNGNEKRRGQEDEIWQEKADQIRIYSGEQYRAVNEAEAGSVCAVMGLGKTKAGEGLGMELSSQAPVLEPVLSYRIELPENCDIHGMLKNLRQLEEEEPHLHILWKEQSGEIHIQLMGEIETEILKRRILERFGVSVEFGQGSIVYKETIANIVEGIGHFEPLRHYAEVHLILEPLERGSGLTFASRCNEDELSMGWQRLAISHLAEKKHVGVLTGSEITDMKITISAGKAHQKHTEGGDFRQAVYRAVRQGLKKAESVLLEPMYEFRIELPGEMVGRLLSDIQRRGGHCNPPETTGEYAIVTGGAPVQGLRGYQSELASYTKGSGKLQFTPSGYIPCANPKEVIEGIGYDSERDLSNPTGSVFCQQGAGILVPWNEVENHMHLERTLKPRRVTEINENHRMSKISNGGSYAAYADEGELEEIFKRTYGPIKRERNNFKKRIAPVERIIIPDFQKKTAAALNKERYLLVDGYNIIFAWEELKKTAAVNLDAARNQLTDILANYKGWKEDTVILVFDAYKVQGGTGSVSEQHGIHVIYTKEAETADQYIERAVHKMGRGADITVATSDNQVQMIIWGDGARRLSARELKVEIDAVNEKIRSSEYLKNRSRNYPLKSLSEELSDKK